MCRGPHPRRFGSSTRCEALVYGERGHGEPENLHRGPRAAATGGEPSGPAAPLPALHAPPQSSTIAQPPSRHLHSTRTRFEKGPSRRRTARPSRRLGSFHLRSSGVAEAGVRLSMEDSHGRSRGGHPWRQEPSSRSGNRSGGGSIRPTVGPAPRHAVADGRPARARSRTRRPQRRSGRLPARAHRPLSPTREAIESRRVWYPPGAIPGGDQRTHVLLADSMLLVDGGIIRAVDIAIEVSRLVVLEEGAHAG